ncbi:hypothetical protein BRDID11002_57650 [Bradyrhizobium diazoefficiens]
MSASIGISLYPDHATDIDTLMQQADAAMYMAKQAGRSTHRLFSAEMNGLTEQRLALIAALRRAIAEGELTLSYQPQIRSCDGAIHGLEALARWHDAELGDVSPAKFIPLAEECGLIEQIGLWSVREACRQMAKLAPRRAQHSLRVGEPVADQFSATSRWRRGWPTFSPNMGCRRTR